MEGISGWASSVHMCRGTTGGCTPDWCSQRSRRKMAKALMSFQPSQMPGTRHQFSSGCLCCIPSLPKQVWGFPVLSPTSHPVEEHESMRVLALRTPLMRAAPPWSLGFQSGNPKRLGKGLKAKLWLHRVRPLCNSTEHGGAAKFQATWSSLQIS